MIDTSKYAGHTPIACAPGYHACPNGIILSVGANWRGYGCREITPISTTDGYKKVRLVINGRRRNLKVHRLIALTFIGPRPSPAHEVCHKDGSRHNNNADNLKWGTRKDNAVDRNCHGKTSRGIKHSLAIKAGLGLKHGN